MCLLATTTIDLSLPDWIVIGGYLLGITAVGLIASRSVRTTENYFLGDRRFNKWLMIGQTFGTGTHAEMPVSLAGAVYSIGASAIWYQWKNLFATPFYWIIAPLFRRMRCTTHAEMTENRYGQWMGAFYAVFALFFFTVNSASMLKGAAKVISEATGGHVPVNAVVIAMTVAFCLYSFLGGLVAAAWTDFIQGFLILTLSFMLIPLGWQSVGGMSGMRAALGPERLSLATPHGIGVWFIVMLTLNGLIGIIAQPHFIASVGTGTNEKACRMGFLAGTFLKRFCTIGWAIVGMMAAAMVISGRFGTTSLGDPEEAFGFAFRHLLFPGGLGLLIASVLATNMAGCSAFLVDSGALFTNSLYRKYFAPTRTDRHYLVVGRLSGVLLTCCGVLYALFLIQRVLYSFLLTETIATYMGIGLLGGVLWRRANRWGAITSFAAAMITNFALYGIRGQRLDAWDPGVFLVSLLVGIAFLVTVSLMTQPEPEARVKTFFERLETPTDLDGSEALPADETRRYTPAAIAAARGQQLLLVNLGNLSKGAANKPILSAYREDLRGFAAGWVIVIALVIFAWALLRV
jgi:Na+/proline symporter